ncbi:MAG TPA: hypothetical protein PLD93_01170 [Synergistaceae bacterium]|nr:hypothetical protein [Synergistaceae bacterium]
MRTHSCKEGDALRLEDLHPETVVRGILPDAVVTVAAVEWHGSEAHPPLSRSPLSLKARK